MFKTSDIALVAWLRYNGEEPDEVVWSNQVRVCYWMYQSNDDVKALINEFEEGDARPEIKRFNKIFGDTKQEMFRLRPAQQPA